MNTYEMIEVKWLAHKAWGVKETTPGHPSHICQLCNTQEEAEALAARYKLHQSDRDMRRASYG